MRHLLTTVSMGAALICVATCAPVENQRGYVPDMTLVSSIQVGMDTKDTISMKLGDPSTAATFGTMTSCDACGASTETSSSSIRASG